MPKILVVDDEPALRFLIIASLEDEGYDLLEAEDGFQAYDLIIAERPEMVILDVMMPGLTGYELCKMLKDNPSTSKIIIILLTAKAQLKDRLASQQVGADYYLIKPFSPLELNEVVASLLQNRREIIS